MDIRVFEADELEHVFRALRTALRPAGLLEPAERRFLETYSLIAGRPLQPGNGPLPIPPEEVRIEGGHARKRLLQLASIAALLACPVREDSVRFVKALGRSLGVKWGTSTR